MFPFAHLLKLERIPQPLIAAIARAIEGDKWQVREWEWRQTCLSLTLLRSLFSALIPQLGCSASQAPLHRVKVMCGFSPSQGLTYMPCPGGERVPFYLSWGPHTSLSSVPGCCELTFCDSLQGHFSWVSLFIPLHGGYGKVTNPHLNIQPHPTLP